MTASPKRLQHRRVFVFRPVLLAFAVALLLPFAVKAGQAQNTPSTAALNIYAPYASSPAEVRFGTPVNLMGRVLPGTATGTGTFYIDNTAVQSSTLTQQMVADYVALGDSVTYASYIADPTQRYQSIVASALNANLSSYASPGYTSCDMMLLNIIPNAIGNTTVSHPLYSLQNGTYDVAQLGTGPGEALFSLCHQAAISWLAVPRASKVLIGDAAVGVLNGTWSTASSFGNSPLNAITSTSGGTVRFNLTTSGGAAYLWYLIQAGQPGSFSVSIDGGTSTTPTSTLFPSGTLDGIPGSYALLRLPATSGAHTFDVTALSGTVGLLGMGTAPPASVSPTTVLVTDVLNQLNGANSSGIAEYTSDIAADVSLLHADGLDVRLVPTQNFMLGTAAEMIDQRLPSALGLSEIAAAFQSVITPSTPVADTIAASVATYSTSSLAIGGHSIGFVYSGDATYASSYTPGVSLVVYDGTSSVQISSSAANVSVTTPVTLTASVANSNASGLVNFQDVTSSSVLLGTSLANPATLTLSTLSPGQHAIVAQYLGDVSYNASTSAPTFVVVTNDTTCTLTPQSQIYFAGAPVPLTATVTPSLATGTVTFGDGNTVLATAAVVNGIATIIVPQFSVGVHNITASYVSSGSFNPSQSYVLPLQITSNSTVTSITAPATGIPGPVTMTASVLPASATGMVQFNDRNTVLGQAPLVNGTATFTATLAQGTHVFAASYLGDANDLPSSSATFFNVLTYLSPSVVALMNVPLGVGPANVRSGAPVFLSMRVAPSATTGSVTFMVDHVPVATAPLTPQINTDYYALGDSITAAVYLGLPSDRYVGIFGASLNALTTNLGAPGYTACQVFPAEALLVNAGYRFLANPIYSLTIGTNDLGFFGTGVHEADFNLCHQAMLSWLSIPPAAKLLATDPSVLTTQGAWTVTTFSGFTTMLTTTTAGSALQMTTTTGGGAAYLWYQLQTDPGSFTVAVDGGQPITVSTQFTSTEATPTSFGVLRIPLASASHTFAVTAQSGTVGILAVGSAAPGVTPLTVLAADVPAQSDGNQAGIAQYTSDIRANIALLAGDGLDIRFVPTQKYFFGTAAETVDGEHPNALGQAEIAQAFEDTLSATGPASGTSSTQTASVTLSNIAIGGHVIDMQYSGDANYASLFGDDLELSVYDGTSSTSLVASGSQFVFGNQVLFTATVPQSVAVGLVDFYDTTAAGTQLLGTVGINPAYLSLSNLGVGQHSIVAHYEGDQHYNASDSTPVVVTITAAPQTINFFPALPTQVAYGALPIALLATASSGLLVSYAVSGPATLSGTALTFTGTGTVTVTATQAGNGNFQSATPVQVQIAVTPAPLTVAVSGSPARIFGTANPALTYTLTGFVNGDSQATATTGSPSISTTAVPRSPAGSYPITVAQGTLLAPNYLLTLGSGQLTVSGGAVQAILFPALSNFANGTTVHLIAMATSGLPVTLTAGGPATISGTTLTITGTGPVTVTASQPGNANFNAAAPVARTFTAQ